MKKWDYKWQVVASVIFGTFMVILDATVVNVALTKLRDVFSADVAQIQWVISGFVLAVGVVTPLSGFLADRFGIKKIYLLSLLGFTIASLLCGLAPSLPFLIAFRILQGLGGGSVIPLGTAMLFGAFPPQERGLAFGIFGIPLVVAPALGPVLGGAFVEYLDWRLIFFINVPIGLLGIFVGSRLLREQKREGHVPLDFAGAFCAVVGFGALLYGFSNAAPSTDNTPGKAATTTGGWNSPDVLISLGVGAFFLIIFAILQLRNKDEALVDLRLFKKPVFTIANIIGWITVIGFFGAEFLLPLYLQILRGLTPFQTGLLLLPLALSSGVLIPFVGKFQDKLGPRPLVTFGFLLLIVNTWQLSDLKTDTSLWYIGFLLVLRGVALACVIQPTQLAALSTVEPRGLPRASSLVNASRSIFQSLGVALLATVLQDTVSNNLANFHPTSATNAAQQSQQAFSGAFLGGLSNAYLLTFWVAAAAAIIALFLPGWPFQKKAAVAPERGAAQPAADSSAMPEVPEATSATMATQAEATSKESRKEPAA